MANKYAENGDRLTDCCGAYSTYDEEGTLYCKACYEEVPPGQGDGTETWEDHEIITTDDNEGRGENA